MMYIHIYIFHVLSAYAMARNNNEACLATARNSNLGLITEPGTETKVAYV